MTRRCHIAIVVAMTAGERLRAWRIREQLTQGEAAAKAGVSQPTWSGWEHDLKEPRLGHAMLVAKMTGGFVGLEHWPELTPGRVAAEAAARDLRRAEALRAAVRHARRAA